MKRFPLVPFIAVALVLAAVVAWPAYVQRASSAARAGALPTPAPVTADYLMRDRLVAFWEKTTAENHRGDMISPRQLAEQYLQRYRERGDLGDVLRAERAAKLALRNQPRGNLAANLQLASIDLTLHRFHQALAITRGVEAWDAGDDTMWVREASLDLEIGDYARADALLSRVPLAKRNDAWRVVESRYLELTGHLDQARDLIAIASAYQNAEFDAPAQQRAWYYFRQGEMAFEAGDNDAAIEFEKTALTVFPNYADANRLLARFSCALSRWQACLDAATASANVVPYPETLGYEVDALRGLGRNDEAKQTDDLIATEERIGNSQHITDRLLAIYYSEHREHLADALKIATGELTARDDIFTEDTLGWAAAMDGRWDIAQKAERKALAFDTENSLLQYHAGVVAEHFGDRIEAKRRFERALALNGSFHQVYADDARERLKHL